MPATVLAVELVKESANFDFKEGKVDLDYVVTFSDSTASLRDAQAATQIGSTDYKTHIPTGGEIVQTYYMCMNHKVDRCTDDGRVFFVTANCSSNYLSAGQFKPSGSNVWWGIGYSATGILYEEPLSKDFSATPKEIRLPTGEPINPELTGEYWDGEATITFKTNADPSINDAYRGYINNDSVSMTVRGNTRTYAINTLKLSRWEYSDYWENGGLYWQGCCVVQYRKDTWISKIQPMSFNIVDGSGNLIRIGSLQDTVTGTTGGPTPTAQFLTSDGTNIVAQGGTLPTPLNFLRLKPTAFNTVLAPFLTIL